MFAMRTSTRVSGVVMLARPIVLLRALLRSVEGGVALANGTSQNFTGGRGGMSLLHTYPSPARLQSDAIVQRT